MVKMVPITHEDPVVKTCIRFTQLASAILKLFERQLYLNLDSTFIRYTILKILVIRGATKPSEIATLTNTKKHNITPLIEHMRKEKLVITRRSRQDRRVVYITVTDKGRELYKQAEPVVEKTIQQVMHGINKSNALEFEKFLDIIQDNLESD